jgi:two-component system chemotaxis response regulator CheB
MERIRVFLVDDAAVVRRLVPAVLSRDPELEVIGTAADGRMALARIPQANPDVVILDLEMPEMDGLETLVALRQTHPRLPVIMFSRYTQRGVEATVHALTLGANDYVPKPGDGLDLEHCVHELLIPKIKLFGRRSSPSEPAPPTPAAPRGPSARPRRVGRQRVEIVAIGASTGGPNALAELLPAFPEDWSMPTVIVQHMPADFTARLAERLSTKARLRVREGAEGEVLSAAQVWVAPGNYHMTVRRVARIAQLALNQDLPVNSCRPSVDVLFQSVAEVYGSSALAVILTGMGEDGLRGCACIREAGGQVLAQDEASSVVWSMPGAVVRAGLADEVVPLGALGLQVVRRVQ